MRALIRSSRISAVAGAVAALCLLWTGQPARAGGGGADLATLQGAIGNDPAGSMGLCFYLGIGPMSSFLGNVFVPLGGTGFGPLTNSPCPQLPTITQAVLQYAGLGNTAPAAVRAATFASIPVANYVDAANPSRPPGLKCLPSTPGCVDPLTGFNGTKSVGFTLPMDLSVTSTLQALAFIPANKSNGTAAPTQLFNSDAEVFFYAVAGLSAAGAVANSSQANSAVFFYEDLQWTNQKPGAMAKLSLPLTVLNSDGSETPVPAVLQFTVPAAGQAPCSASTVVSRLWPSPGISPAAIGVNCVVVSGTTQFSEKSHAVVEVSASLLINMATDPNYFLGLLGPNFPTTFSALPSVFQDNLGFTPTGCPGSSKSCILGANGQSIGIAPGAAPFGSPSTTTPANYSLCANLPSGNGNGQAPVPSVAAFYSIAPDGVVNVSSALAPTPPGIVCPTM